MKEFTYTIKDELGIHARPAGMLAKKAKGYADTAVTLSANGKTVNLAQLMKLMALGVKQGTEVTVCCEGRERGRGRRRPAGFPPGEPLI